MVSPAREEQEVSALPASLGAITLFVADPERSKAFYQQAFDQPVAFEDASSVVFKFGDVFINLLADSAAPELIGPATVSTQQAGTRFQLTIWVDDADAACAELTARGVALLNGPMDRAWGMRTASFEDPDGHIWEVAQELARG
jgi:catechol 2,3-dioxygenase-like lactoylglutathione lyase family enzyme